MMVRMIMRLIIVSIIAMLTMMKMAKTRLRTRNEGKKKNSEFLKRTDTRTHVRAKFSIICAKL